MQQLSFLGTHAALELSSLNDFWNFPLEARIRSIAIHGGKLERLPWEAVAYPSGQGIPNYPDAVQIADELLVDARNSRQQVLNIFKDYSAKLNFSEMRKVMGPKWDDIINGAGGDKFFRIEQAFLQDIVEPLVENRVRGAALELFPVDASEPDKTYATCMAGLQNLKTSSDAQACRTVFFPLPGK